MRTSKQLYVPFDHESGQRAAIIPVGQEDWVAEELAREIPTKGGFSIQHGEPSRVLMPADSENIETFDRVLGEIRTGKRKRDLRLFHSTTSAQAEAILAHGFHDSPDGLGLGLVGVLLADRQLDQNEGARGPVVLRVSLALSVEEVASFELLEEAKPYREFLIPAEILNDRAHLEFDVEDETS